MPSKPAIAEFATFSRSKISHFVLCLLTLITFFPSLGLFAQTPTRVSPGTQIQLQVAQPTVDKTIPVTVTAVFDPPTITVGEKAFYRVSFTTSESSVNWPEQIPLPGGLQLISKHTGQITELRIDQYRPLAAFVYEVTAPAAGRVVVPSFTVNVSGVPTLVPPATLDVVTNRGLPSPRRLRLDISATNIFLGQPFHARIILQYAPGQENEALREIDLSGKGLMVDKTQTRLSIEPLSLDGKEARTTLICEMLVTPISAGSLKFSAQGFTAGHEFTFPMVIHGPVNISPGPPKYELLISDPVQINVRPLPVEGELPGFTGAIGNFTADPPHLSASRVHVGEPIKLSYTIHVQGDLPHFAPPAAPVSSEWQIIEDPPPATSFTLIPLTDETHGTPAIPYSFFNPKSGKYVNLTIPSLPVIVVGESLPAELSMVSTNDTKEVRRKLSSLATMPGKSARTLRPMQLQPHFIILFLLPVIVLALIWQWDRHRQFLAAHPEIVRRAKARRALRRQHQLLQQAISDGNVTAFIHHAADAFRIAAAPHYPAEPKALTCADILAQLHEPSLPPHAEDIVRQVFAADDAHYSVPPIKPSTELLALNAGVQSVLRELEEKL